MSENSVELRDDFDLLAVLAAGLRDAHRAGETERVEAVFATLGATVHRLSAAIDPRAEHVATLVHRGDAPDVAMVARLVGR